LLKHETFVTVPPHSTLHTPPSL